MKLKDIYKSTKINESWAKKRSEIDKIMKKSGDLKDFMNAYNGAKDVINLKGYTEKDAISYFYDIIDKEMKSAGR